jgi:hypothetical protein
VEGNSIVVAVDHKTALQLMEIKQIASAALIVVRVPGDTSHVTTTEVNPETIAQFGF